MLRSRQGEPTLLYTLGDDLRHVGRPGGGAEAQFGLATQRS